MFLLITILFAAALAAQESPPDPQVLLQKGLHAYQQRDYEVARRTWQQGLRLAEEQQDDLFAGSFHGNLGIIYSVLGDYEKAARHLERSVEMAREAGDQQGLKTRLNSLGGLYLRLEQPDKALEHLREALPIARNLSDYRTEASILANIGDAYRTQGNNQEAASALREGLAVAGEHDLAELEVNILSKLGVTYAAMGNYPQALGHFRQAIATVQEAPPSEPKAVTLVRDYNRMGRLLREIGDPVAAVALHQSAVEEARRAGLPKLVAASEAELAQAGEEIGDGSSAHLRSLQVQGLRRMSDRLLSHGFTEMAAQVRRQAARLEEESSRGAAPAPAGTGDP